ncbi:MAG: monovalent cation:proton antiporter-2 (CPA2) family protein [Verrucomicrobiota bacterium]
MDSHLFSSALIYLVAAAVAAPLGRRLGLGAVIGYLLIGVLIGPQVGRLVGEDYEEVMHVAEFGVVLMLFVIGLEIDLSRLWRMRKGVLGLGGLQVSLTSLAIAGVGVAFGFDWRQALAGGLILSLSSTAIVMQTLKERGLSETVAGQQSFAVLLFQDIAVIPILALLPLLAVEAPDHLGGADPNSVQGWIDTMPIWSRGLITVAALAIIVVIGRYLLSPWLRWIAGLKVPEALTATTLAVVVGVALLMDSVGLSPALGTFVAGVVLASSEFRHELESDIEPFRSLLLAVFFLSVGAAMDFELIANDPAGIAGLVAVLVVVKFAVLALLGRGAGMSFDQRSLFAAALAQGGEFAFVLGGFASARGVLDAELAAKIIAATVLSMALAPVLLLVMQTVVLPRFGTLRLPGDDESQERASDVENDRAEVLLVGFGRFGHPIARLLRSAGLPPTVLEKDSDHVDFLRRIGLKCYYGDATRLPLLRAAGAAEAKLILLALDNEEDCVTIIHHCRRHFPHLKILARACSRDHAYQLHDLDVAFFVEQLGSSLDCAIQTLIELGHQRDHANDAARRFKEMEIRSIAELALHQGDDARHLSEARRRIEELDSLLSNAPLPVRGAEKVAKW